ncbi:MAG: hypothetical protein RQ714_07105 [Nitrosomonas sp.]|nr:hypothetical protein [Nitrosomonas sp.]
MSKHHSQSFFRTEDFWAISLGGFLLLTALALYFSLVTRDVAQKITSLSAAIERESTKPVKTVAWYEATAELAKLKLSQQPAGYFLKTLTALPNRWSSDPLEAIHKPAIEGDLGAAANTVSLAREQALIDEQAARSAGFELDVLNQAAQTAIDAWQRQLTAYEKSESKLKAGNFWLCHN